MPHTGWLPGRDKVIPVSNILALHHVSVIVADTARALGFYRDTLGLDLDPQRPDLGYPGAWLKIGDQQLHLLELPNPDPVTGRPAHGGRSRHPASRDTGTSLYGGRDRHFAFAIRDLDALRARFDAKGVAYTLSKSGRRALFCRDPDGNALELMENPE